MHTKSETPSAIRNAYQTASSPHSIARKYAAGISTIICRQSDMIMLFTPWPTAWNSGKHDANRCKREAEADGAQRAHANLHHMVGSIKQRKKHIREELEHQQANGHDRKCIQCPALERLHQALFVARAVVKAHDGQCARTQTEDRRC